MKLLIANLRALWVILKYGPLTFSQEFLNARAEASHWERTHSKHVVETNYKLFLLRQEVEQLKKDNLKLVNLNFNGYRNRP